MMLLDYLNSTYWHPGAETYYRQEIGVWLVLLVSAGMIYCAFKNGHNTLLDFRLAFLAGIRRADCLRALPTKGKKGKGRKRTGGGMRGRPGYD